MKNPDPTAFNAPAHGSLAPPPGNPYPKRPRWVWAAVGGAVAAVTGTVIVIGLQAAPSNPISHPSRASSAPRQAAQPISLAPFPAPKPDLTASELQKVLAATPTLPSPYKPYGKIITFQGSGHDLPQGHLDCPDVAKIFGDLAAENSNYAADAEVYALDPAGDELRIELVEAVNPAAATRDLAALRVSAQSCPVIGTSFEGAFHLTAGSLAGGSDNIDLHMAQSPHDITGGHQFGPQDMLIVQDGRYLVDVAYTLQNNPGAPRQSGLPPSILPPSAKIAESVLSDLAGSATPRG